MADRDLWIAGQMSEYRRLPLEWKTILFIEDYSGSGGGLVTSIFKKMLANPNYMNHRFVWTTRDYESALDQFGELISTERVWIVSRGMPDFLRGLSVAGLIISEGMLPNYFIKREGQRIYSSLARAAIPASSYSRNQVQNFVKTMEDTDYFLCRDDQYEESLLRNEYGIAQNRIMRIKTEGRRGVIDGDEKKKAIVMIENNRSLLKSGASFAAFLNKTKAILDFYDIEMTAYVSNSFWNKYKSQKDYFGFENVYCEEIGAPDLEEACLLITDSIPRVLMGQNLHKPVLFWGERRALPNYYPFYQKCYCASGYPAAYSIFEELFGGLGVDSSFLYAEDRLDEQKMEEEKEDLINKDCIESKKAIPTEPERRRVLYIIRWEKDLDYPKRVMNWLEMTNSPEQEITLLFLNSGEGKLYKVLSRFMKPYRIACRSGFYQSTGWERQMVSEHRAELDDYLENTSHSFIEDEWKRLVGSCRFDTIVAEKTKDYFWNIMYRYSPTDQFVLMDKKTKEKMLNSWNQSAR